MTTMRRLNSVFFILFLSLLIGSCTKNKLDDIELPNNPADKWTEDNLPLRIRSAVLRSNQCITEVSWSIDQEYIDLIEGDPNINVSDINVEVIRSGIPRQRTALKTGGFLNDSHCEEGAPYALLINFPDGSQSRSATIFSSR